MPLDRHTEFVAVEGASFKVNRGETFGLIGESGSGKTTVGRMLLRLLEPTSGYVEFDGFEVTKLAAPQLRALRRRMQIVFQDPYASLNPRQTVRATLRAGPKQKIVEAMVDVPAVLKEAKHVEAFHAAVRKKLKLRK